MDGSHVVDAQWAGARGHDGPRHLAVERRPRHAGRHRRGDGFDHPPDEHVGLVHVDARRHLRQHRRGAGEHADHRAAAADRRRARRQAIEGGQGRHLVRGDRLPLRAAAHAPARALRAHGGRGGAAHRRHRRPAPRRHQRPDAAHPARREGRPRRPFGRGQVHADQPAPALLRPREGPGAHRRPGCVKGHAG